MNVSISNNQACARLITSACHTFLLVYACGGVNASKKDAGAEANSIHDISNGSLYRIKAHETTGATYEYMYLSKQGEYAHLNLFLLESYWNITIIFMLKTNILFSRGNLFRQRKC